MEYRIYKSQLIIQNKSEMVKQIHKAHSIHQKYFPGNDSTWTYKAYNFFGLTSPSPLFSDLFFELKEIIHDYIPEKKMWMQSWLNYHLPNQVLPWHDHHWDYHGYISIDPKGTKTVFEGYEINNEVGNIYIGPGYRKHKVVVEQYYNEPRITIGFDVCLKPDNEPNDLLSLMPI